MDDGQASTMIQEEYEEDNTSRVDAAIAAFTALSQDERSTLVLTIGGRKSEEQDFPDT